jgi:hypothetical protein
MSPAAPDSKGIWDKRCRTRVHHDSSPRRWNTCSSNAGPSSNRNPCAGGADRGRRRPASRQGGVKQWRCQSVRIRPVVRCDKTCGNPFDRADSFAGRTGAAAGRASSAGDAAALWLGELRCGRRVPLTDCHRGALRCPPEKASFRHGPGCACRRTRSPSACRRYRLDSGRGRASLRPSKRCIHQRQVYATGTFMSPLRAADGLATTRTFVALRSPTVTGDRRPLATSSGIGLAPPWPPAPDGSRSNSLEDRSARRRAWSGSCGANAIGTTNRKDQAR